jgi:hypothetical protein
MTTNENRAPRANAESRADRKADTIRAGLADLRAAPGLKR